MKEVKLIAQARNLRIHQYLDDWLLRSPTKEQCFIDSQNLVKLVQEVGWFSKVRIGTHAKTGFLGYHFEELVRGHCFSFFSISGQKPIASDGPDSIKPVVIPALATMLDSSLVVDKSLCPVRALKVYLDKTKSMRKGKAVLLVSLREGYSKDITRINIS